jgi:hypothetical protein
MKKVKGKQCIRYYVKCRICGYSLNYDTDKSGYSLRCPCGACIEVE